MWNIKRVLTAGVLAGVLGAVGCGAAPQRPVDMGALSVDEGPPEPTDVYFETKAGQVWVAGRWARIGDQWIWQAGHHEPARDGFVYCAGYWDRKDKTFVWVPEEWKPVRDGYVFEPGHYGFRGRTYVWIRDAWEPLKYAEIWVPGSWEIVAGEHAWNDGHWEDASATR